MLVTDENVYKAHRKKFSGWNTVIVPPGEHNKVQATADGIITELMRMEADRSSTIVGVGGGVITDLTGYVASVYMRGIRAGLVPTSLLAQVDAAIGGKNGIDVGLYKNLVGTIRQPAFILYDNSFLDTLPASEWENGFAEIIKHACIRDAAMFRQLRQQTASHYRNNKSATGLLVRRNAMLKTKLVQRDEFEKGERRLLNFGHTLGHALENQYALSHGQAVAVGMVSAARISEKITGYRDTEKLVRVLEQYGLPVRMEFDRQKVFDILKMDKKRERRVLNFILLEKTGRGIVHPMPLAKVEKLLGQL